MYLPKRNLLFIFFGVTSGAFILFGFGARLYQFQLSAPKDDPAKLSFVIEPGESAAQIAQKLEREGFIRNKDVFRFYLWKEGLEKSLQAGEYKLRKSFSVPELIEAFSHGVFNAWVTIIPGWRREEVVVKIVAQEVLGNVREADLLLATAKKEGKLFPETYLVPKDITARKLVGIFEAEFEKNVSSLVPQFEKNGLSLTEATILASIIEREVQSEEDKALVAGILIKRLRSGWRLEADATVQYAVASTKLKAQNAKLKEIDFWPKNLTPDDLRIDSPYNTRLKGGLPPGPISNPGLSALKAVAFFKDSSDWFYLSDREGKIHYAQTLDKHNANVQRFLR